MLVSWAVDAFMHQQPSVALDAMVQHCSQNHIVNTLLNTEWRWEKKWGSCHAVCKRMKKKWYVTGSVVTWFPGFCPHSAPVVMQWEPAQHLRLLVDRVQAANVMTAGRTCRECSISADFTYLWMLHQNSGGFSVLSVQCRVSFSFVVCDCCFAQSCIFLKVHPNYKHVQPQWCSINRH